MNVNHLHLHVRDLAASRAFYERHFGLRERCWHGEILFLRDEAGFDLALAPSPEPEPLPAWFHFGFRLAGREEVDALRRRLEGAGVTPFGVVADEPDFACFRCRDPDGHAIEVYWEP